jgi:hypothetical protein
VAVAHFDSFETQVIHRKAQAGVVEGYQRRDGGQVDSTRVKGAASTLGGSRCRESCGVVLELNLVLFSHGIRCPHIAQAF